LRLAESSSVTVLAEADARVVGFADFGHDQKRFLPPLFNATVDAMDIGITDPYPRHVNSGLRVLQMSAMRGDGLEE
jgi:hypothetical protein